MIPIGVEDLEKELPNFPPDCRIIAYEPPKGSDARTAFGIKTGDGAAIFICEVEHVDELNDIIANGRVVLVFREGIVPIFGIGGYHVAPEDPTELQRDDSTSGE